MQQLLIHQILLQRLISDLANWKSEIDKLDNGKLKTSVDLSKISDVVKNESC